MAETPAASSRYGRSPMTQVKRRRLTIALTTLAVAAGVAVAATAYQRFEGTAVEGKTVAFDVLDGQTVSVTISVTRDDPAISVVCIVRARSHDGAETGRREILIEPSEAKTVQVTADVTSYRRPFVGDIYGCGTDIPPYLGAP
jgi:hypothetical protein